MKTKTPTAQTATKHRNTIQITISPRHKAMMKGISGLRQKSLQQMLEGWIEMEADQMGLTFNDDHEKETSR